MHTYKERERPLVIRAETGGGLNLSRFRIPISRLESDVKDGMKEKETETGKETDKEIRIDVLYVRCR